MVTQWGPGVKNPKLLSQYWKHNQLYRVLGATAPILFCRCIIGYRRGIYDTVN